MPDTFLYKSDSEGAPRLRIGRCSRCGHTFFPMQRFGCERCGARGDALAEDLVTATGTVLTAVTVWRHRAPGIETPFQVASVRLDAGPVLGALLAAGDKPSPLAGARVRGTLTEHLESPVPPLRFTVVNEVAA